MELPLDFQPGLGFQDFIWRKFGLPIKARPGQLSGFFTLVVSFGRCKSKLSQALVSKLLQSVLGGRASDFRVSLLHDRVFKFMVSLKQVGFHVYKLHSYACDLFKLYFHLWGNGGPAWIREFQAYAEDESNSWTHVP